MEPENRPYVDSGTEPGDTGTDEWADKPAASGDAAGKPPAKPAKTTDGVVDDSPADEFINDPDVVEARNDKEPKV